jgi:ABC-type phosphate/phosphonate transport system ATPase subunit
MDNNSYKKQVIVITGPSGAGKSTLSRRLAVELGCTADIDIENINYMIVNGFKEIETNNKNGLSFNKWNLAGDTIGLIASNFLDKNYRVIIHGHVTEELLSCIEKQVDITHKIMLLPNISSVILRDKTRANHLSMGEGMVRKHYEYFLTNNWDDFNSVDSTNEDVSTTLARIKVILDR